MVAQFRVSRRYVLSVTAAVGGLAMSGGIARGQNTPRIEKLAPELDKIISTSDPVQHLADASAARSAQRKARFGGRKVATCCSATFTTTGE
jgi:hypothetical protein